MKATLPITLGLVTLALCASHSAHASVHDEAPDSVFSDLPGIRAKGYTVDSYINAAARLQSLAKDKGCSALSVLAQDGNRDDQVILLCRLLFRSKKGGEFRAPRIGAPRLLGGSSTADWPLVPLEIVDGVPFLITGGYRLHGLRESAQSYLAYCMRNCEWSRLPIVRKSKDKKSKALAKLLGSGKWKRALEVQEKAFLVNQVIEWKSPTQLGIKLEKAFRESRRLPG